ncbi:hypothetical protein MMAG44476_18592 [Mycolicibacterium mageritense DSM 44476 = CIP 104973]|uniref:Exported or membrane protein n=1 Tax=Mycolicibacterium mageritense TaxID=53462 RepID=A0ABN5Y0Q1_MYCME|nr:hypothetical protein [Mycolicibacterium mageritense]MCC9183513.1 hypothetical protein [Mycolicibacterium mageritense]BBX31813.1 hypothetical protein MMAGJ_10950 [Mycolicibacterium mageritense]CDO23640.1 exported or membrane protein [Mycolicibacterium mageritense DSM 44476 = CIP 104973]
MSNVNWWLMGLAFVLGVALTLALTVRRVKREVPVYGALGRGPGTGGAGASATPKHAAADDATTKLPKVGVPGAMAAGAAAAGVAGAAAAAGKDDTAAAEQPYGAGSIRTAATATAPDGYSVKGNEDSMLYHTTESPSYQQTVAEIWFVDEESAVKAGFNRWDSGKSQRGK